MELSSNIVLPGEVLGNWMVKPSDNTIMSPQVTESSLPLTSSPASTLPFHSLSTRIPSSLLVTHIFSFALFANNDSETTPSTPLSSSLKYDSQPNPSTFEPLSEQPPFVNLDKKQRLISQPRQSKSIGVKSRKSLRRPPPHDDILTVINSALNQYFDPFVIGVGILGNFMLFFVFLHTPLSARPLSHAVSGIGISDLVYVLSFLMVYLSSKEKPIYDVPGVCQVTMFVVMLSRSLQTWYMLVAHLDRLNAHFHGSFERRKRRVFNTKFVLFVMAMVAAALPVHVLWSFETVEYAGRSYCLPMRDSLQYYLIIRKVHIIVSVIIPLTLIAGVDLILLLKFTLYIMCKNDDDDDTDEILDNADGGGYNSYRPSHDSSLCTDHIIRFPLRDRKSDSNGHNILTNGIVAGTSKMPSQLATIKELSSDNNSSSLRNFAIDKLARQGNLEVNAGLTPVDIHSIMPSDKKKEVARYILTLSEEYTAENENDSIVEFTTKNKQLIEEQTTLDKGEWSKLRSEKDHQNNNNKDTLNPNQRNNRSNRKNHYRLNNSYSQYSQSASHIRTCDFTSFASNISRTTVIPEDHMFSEDTVACSLTTLISGLILAALIIPSSYIEGRNLFIDPSSNSRPTHFAMQQALFSESLVKLNAIYKILLYFCALSSFRQAFMWLLTDWFPRKCSRMSKKIRAFNTAEDKDIIYV